MTETANSHSKRPAPRKQRFRDQTGEGQGSDPRHLLASLSFQSVGLSLIFLGGVLLLAAWLRWRYIVSVQPNPDEFVTLLAVKMILQHGVPVLPSGLFYEHGLLFSYAGAAASTLLGFSRESVRAVSLIFGLLALILTWFIGRRWFSPGAGLLAGTLMAVASAAVLWGGRARMYTLLQVWVLLMLFFGYVGTLDYRIKRPGMWRVFTLLCILGASLTQFAAITLVPPLVIGTFALGWLEARRRGKQAYFNSPRVWLEIGGLIAVVLVAFLVKRAGQPKGVAPLETTGAGVMAGVTQVVAIYAGLTTNLSESWQALAPFFIAPESLLPTLLASLAAVWAGVNLVRRQLRSRDLSALFLTLVLVLTTLEMVFFVSQERRDEKYLFMLQPALFLLAADGLMRIVAQLPSIKFQIGNGSSDQPFSSLGSHLLVLVLCLALIAFNGPATSALLGRTGSDYDAAFGYVREQWQDGDAVLTGTPAAAAFYLGRNDYYAVRGTEGYAYRVLERDGQKVERWMGSPWLETDQEIFAALNASPRVWLVLERWGLIKEYYSPFTMQRILSLTDFVREDNGIIVLRSRPGASLIAEEPRVPHSVNFDDQLILHGYDLSWQETGSTNQGDHTLSLDLFWEALQPLDYDYTVFVHLRDADGRNVAQADHQPLAPVFPPTLWPPGQPIRERSALRLTEAVDAGSYSIWVGLYRLDTLERLPVHDDTSGENAVLLGQVTIP